MAGISGEDNLKNYPPPCLLIIILGSYKTMNVTANDNKEYARVLSNWLDTLVLTGSTGRRAVFVERSLKRQYHKTIQNALKIRLSNVPSNWQSEIVWIVNKSPNWPDSRRCSWIQQVLWNLTVEISRKFKTEIPIELNFRQTMSKI
jgi:hypothetical protein